MTNTEKYNIYPNLTNGAQLPDEEERYFVVSLYGTGGTREEKLAFVCQYADSHGQKVLLLDECGVFRPKRWTKKPETWAQVKRFIQKAGMIDVLRAATFGEHANCYATAWSHAPELANLGYDRVFVASEDSAGGWARAAVEFPGKSERMNDRINRKVYDQDVIVLGIFRKDEIRN